jgi:pyroglutamyl-peptidase
MADTQAPNPKILITGFDRFLSIAVNPSYEIARRLPNTITTSSNTTAQLIVSGNAIPAKYHELLDLTTKLIEEHKPDIVLHMGLAHGRTYFAVEKGAEREGYHEVPDESRRVLTRAENKKTFAKEAARLDSTLDLEAAVAGWQAETRGIALNLQGAAPGARPGAADEKPKEKGRGKQKLKAAADSSFKGLASGSQVDVRLSDDVGNYVCGLQYYVSLLEMQKRTGRRDSVFLHVPYLESLEEIQIGVRVTEGLIRALVGVWLDRQ